MSYATEYVAATLKAAREAKRLSQRELGAKSGVPQGHISKIEAGAVDLRLSSLVTLARILDLELMLVPRKTVSAVQSIARRGTRGTLQNEETALEGLKELKRIEKSIADLPQTAPFAVAPEEARLKRLLYDLRHVHFTAPDVEALRGAHKAIKAFGGNPENRNAIRQALAQLQNMRDTSARGPVSPSQIVSPRPAYNLDEDDDG